jgi:hypothetical protein
MSVDPVVMIDHDEPPPGVVYSDDTGSDVGADDSSFLDQPAEPDPIPDDPLPYDTSQTDHDAFGR